MGLLERFRKFIESIRQEDNLAIFYHAKCTDGLCSCIITSKSITKLTGLKPKFHIQNQHEINEDTLIFIKSNKIKKVIFVDLCPEGDIVNFKKLESYSEILIIDHHKFKNNLDSKNTILVHAEFLNNKIDSVRYPASKLCYDLFSNLVDISELDLLAAIGLIGDRGYNTWKDFVDSVADKYKFNIEGDILTSIFGKASSLISTTSKFEEASILIFDVVYNSKNINGIINNKELQMYEIKVRKEISYWVDRADDAEICENLVIFEIKPKLKINSPLSTILSFEKFGGKTLVIIADYGNDILTISAREQSMKIKMNELLQEAVNGLDGAKSGGHIPAAGGTIRKQDKNKFKKQLIAAYNKLNK